MAEKRYDVIIVGAGISGLKLAELLNDSKLNVLLVEKRPTIKKLVNHIYGVIPWEYIEKWDLHKYLIRKQGFGFGQAPAPTSAMAQVGLFSSRLSDPAFGSACSSGQNAAAGSWIFASSLRCACSELYFDQL